MLAFDGQASFLYAIIDFEIFDREAWIFAWIGICSMSGLLEVLAIWILRTTEK